jgi:hypothetical protein
MGDSAVWQKKRVNCAVLPGNIAGLRTVLPVVFHTQYCAVHPGNPIVSSVYLPTPRWHHLKALNLPKWTKEKRSLRSLKRTDRYLNFGTQKIDIIATESKRQRHMTPLTTALFLSTRVTRTRRQRIEKKWQTWWETCAVPGNIQFSFSCSFFTHLNSTV